MLLLCNKLNKVLNLPCMCNGKLIGPTHCDAMSADSMQYWDAFVSRRLREVGYVRLRWL